MDQATIDRYARQASAPRTAIAGLSPADLDAFPVPGKWSIRQLIIHLMDSDVIAEDNPLLMGYNESAFAKNLFYNQTDAGIAADVFEKSRLIMADILLRLPASAFDRAGIHSERGRETLAQFVVMYCDHLDHHMKFLREKRTALGKPL